MNRIASKELREFRRFGLLMAVVLGALGGWFFFRGRSAGILLLAIGICFLLLATFAPGWLKYPHRYWMALSQKMGKVMTSLILVLFYFLVVAPIGILGRIFGKRFLPEGPDTSKSTYWTERRGGDSGEEDLERQF